MAISTLWLTQEAPSTHQAACPCSIVLADSNPEFRRGLRSLLEFYNDHSPSQCVVLGEVASGAQAVDLSRRHHPSLVIIDVNLDNDWASTVDILVQLKCLERAPKTLLIAAAPEPAHLFDGMQAGAAGILTKNHIATELLSAIHTIEAGHIYLNQAMVSQFFYLFQNHGKQAVDKCKQLRLSQREQEVLRLLARGDSNEAIAQELFISIATVKSHFTNIFEKLEVKTRTQAIIRALRLGLV